ncbi:MAG TPA: condensation domain-containing protein, partial [Pinirhizobacter sp.]|nr:condensation domain-containing protein [Pinirhizobacter sp.]
MALSFGQQRLWFLCQLEGVSATYHMPVALRLRGPLDRTALQHSLDHLLARHEALRTVFHVRDGQPQAVLLPADAGFALREQSTDDDAALWQLRAEEAAAPFDLGTGPLIRGRLIRRAPDDHVFLLTQHHIVSDGWSVAVMAREISALYAAFANGGDDACDPLPPLPIQYPDYAAWQRQWLSGERQQAQAAYWKAQLEGVPTLLELPTDHPRPATQSFAGARLPIHIDATLAQGLKRVSQRHGSTVFMTVLSAWAAVLSRLSRQDDLVIGIPTAHRNRQELEGLVGFFVNTLALRIDLSGQPSVGDLLGRVRQTVLAAQDHQDLPFEQVVEIVQPPRRLDHTPLFQVMFNWHNNDEAVLDLPGIQVTATPVAQNVTAKFDLQLDLAESADGIVGGFTYATALFDEAAIERHRGYLLRMLEALVADADQPVMRIDVLPAAERELLLHTWNDTGVVYDTERCIHQLFEDQVARTPDAIALVQDDVELTYAELNAQANRLAHRLIDMGVRPDSRVAICVDRRPHMVVGLLAILKAGGAYVPMDPAYPVDRIVELLADAEPTLLLADTIAREALGAEILGTVPALFIDQVPNVPDGRDGNPDADALGLTSSHLAYVIYTSGSTGKPKGVMVEHRQVRRLLHITQDEFAFGADDVWTLFHSMAFDFSVWEVWGALAHGGRLVVVPYACSRSPDVFFRLLIEKRVTVLNQTPSA